MFVLYKVLSNYIENNLYRTISKTNIHKLMDDKGAYGEYLTFNILKNIDGKILTNLYLPKLKGGTTEVDLVFINSKGIFVIESKNYSGRIYGSSNSKFWMQILKNNQRNKFYNPIFQNRIHINAIKNILKDVNENDIYSIVVFSERCNIDNVNVSSENVKVIKRNYLESTIKDIMHSNFVKFNDDEVNDLHNKLLRYSDVSEIEKEQHIQNIKNMYSRS